MYVFAKDYQNSYWIIKDPTITEHYITGQLVQTNQEWSHYTETIRDHFILYRTHPMTKIEHFKYIKLVKYKLYKTLNSLTRHNFMELL